MEAMDMTELREWAQYERLEPWGPDRGDLRAGIIAATIANCHRDPKRRSTPFAPKDFMPEFDAPMLTGSARVDEMAAWARSYTVLAGRAGMVVSLDRVPEWALTPAQRAAQAGARASALVITDTDKG